MAMVVPIPTRRVSEGTGGASRAGHGQRPSLARLISVSGLLGPGIDEIARNRAILFGTLAVKRVRGQRPE